MGFSQGPRLVISKVHLLDSEHSPYFYTVLGDEARIYGKCGDCKARQRYVRLLKRK